jgi:hypothetical protein
VTGHTPDPITRQQILHSQVDVDDDVQEGVTSRGHCVGDRMTPDLMRGRDDAGSSIDAISFYAILQAGATFRLILIIHPRKFLRRLCTVTCIVARWIR